MRISYQWLRQFVQLPDSFSPLEVAERLKLATVEVEGVEEQGKSLEGVVVGLITEVNPHPNADRLKICSVEAGSGPLQVVCGGSNVRPEMKVAFAPIGTSVRWHGEGESIVLEKAVIRGVESFGMICAADEIGLGEMFPATGEKEILDLSHLDSTGKVVGRPLAEALGLNDTIFEIDNKSLSHRPDLWGHYGLAREVSALFKKELKAYQPAAIAKTKKPTIKLQVKVADTNLCPRYMAVALSGITVAPSPVWLATKLRTAGIRPINNVVDITNYILLELGQPLHAFDADAVKGGDAKHKHINVRLATSGEKIMALDGKEYSLHDSMLVIADDEKPLAIAGVMGGEASGIIASTNTIIIEAANFAPAGIRKTSLALGLRSDSSVRFEKSLDPHFTALALARAVELIGEIIPGAVVASAVVDESHFHLQQGPISFPWHFVSEVLGVPVEQKRIVETLTALGFEVKERKEECSVKIPSWRATKDVAIPEDLVEEVARVYGFDNIPGSLPALPIAPSVSSRLRTLEEEAVTCLVRELQYTEIYHYSFMSSRQAALLGDTGEFLELDNPISKERPLLRRSLLPNLLESLVKNEAHRDELKLVEIGKVYVPEEPGLKMKKSDDGLLPRQDTWVTALYSSKKNDNPFFEARRAAELLALRLGGAVSFEPVASVRAWQHPARVADLVVGEIVVGQVFEVSPQVAEAFGATRRVGVVEINLTLLSEQAEEKLNSYYPIPLFPEVVRDVALLVSNKTAHAELLSAIRSAHPLVIRAELFDVYAGAHVAAGKKSMAYRITYAHRDHTLTSEEIDTSHAAVLATLKKSCGAEVRE